jgi:hypothetical protein
MKRLAALGVTGLLTLAAAADARVWGCDRPAVDVEDADEDIGDAEAIDDRDL